jgi:predicted 3-demethylubiquinone-9 3-methyltransferase (glyoxalase superfamily)
MQVQKIHPFLWFENQAEEAMRFYTSVFKSSEAGEIMRWGDTGPGEPGSVVTASFKLEGLQFTALNGGPEFKFNESISFHVRCDSQEEVDYYWEKLIAGGGEESQCGWLKDKFGVSWQIVPSRLMELLSDPDPGRAGRATQAMLQMHKIDIATLERAAAS